MSARRGLRAVMALCAVTCAGCIFWVDDPEGWTALEQVSVSCTEFSSSCICQRGSSVSESDCSSSSLGGSALCCADLDYPAERTSCSCELLSCLQYSDGSCSCSLGTSSGSSSSCSPLPGQVCCRTSSGCECGEDVSCLPSQVVTRCDISQMVCEKKTVISCSSP